ncbi:MAG: hypothetical protein LCH95_22845, partial [Proteobacteria bacterium]|nr:hypothetical protein [Pseudomonadota bacterium]
VSGSFERDRSAREASMMTVRRGLLLFVAAAALTAVLGGLARLGLAIGFGPSVADRHGPFFVLGVFGTVISLERAVALGRSWALAAPVVSIAATLALLAQLSFAPGLFVVAVAFTLIVNAAIIRRQSAAFTWLMLLGSVASFAGTLGWAHGATVFDVTPQWMSFFVLTIVAERLELSRLAPTPTWASRALVIVSLALAGASVLGLRLLMGATLVLLGLWLARFDLARRTVRLSGLPRFTALGVLAGAAIELRKRKPVGSIVVTRAAPRNLELMRNLGLHRLLTIDAGEAAGSLARAGGVGHGYSNIASMFELQAIPAPLRFRRRLP